MAGNVYVDQTTCRTSADSSDDIYMLVFRGGTTSPFRNYVSVIRTSAWADFDDDESRGNDIPIAPYYANNVYVVSLFERDADNDFIDGGGTYLDLVRTSTNLAWVTQMAALSLEGSGTPSAEERELAAKATITAMQGTMGIAVTWPVGDDDMIGRAKHLEISPGHEPTLPFAGQGGRYQIRFKIKD